MSEEVDEDEGYAEGEIDTGIIMTEFSLTWLWVYMDANKMAFLRCSETRRLVHLWWMMQGTEDVIRFMLLVCFCRLLCFSKKSN